MTTDDLSGLPVEADLPCCPIGDEWVQQLSQRELNAFTDATQYLAENDADINALCDTLADDVADVMMQGQAAFDSLGDELLGAVDLILDAEEAKLLKFFGNFYSATDKMLNSSLAELMNAGFQVPFHWQEQSALMEGDWLAMLAAGVPGLADRLNYTLPGAAQIAATPPTPEPSYVPGDTTLPEDFVPWVPTAPADTFRNPVDDVATGPSQDEATETVSCTTDADGRDVTVNVDVHYPPPPAPPPPSAYDPTMPPRPFDPAYLDPLKEPPPNRPLIPNAPVDPTQPRPPVAPPSYYPPTVPPESRRPPAAPTYPTSPPPTRPRPTQPPPTPATTPTTYAAEPKPVDLLWPGQTMMDKVSGPDGVDWNKVDACALAAKVVKGPEKKAFTDQRPAGQRAKFDQAIDAILPFDTADVYAVLDGWQQGPLGGVITFARTLWDDVLWVDNKLRELVFDKAISGVATSFLGPTSMANPTATMYYAGRVSVASLAERKTGMPFTYLYQSDQYLMQYSDPQFLPNQIRIDSAYLSGQINDETWTCWTRANGNLPEPSRRVMLADQQKPGIRELIDLRNRGLLRDADLFDRMREQGVLDPNYVKEWVELAKQLPTASDLIRYMVRDAADEEVAKKYRLDEGFTDKFTGKMKQWGAALGLTDEVFKYAWRSHWRVSSDTQLFEMFHRLRPDRPEVLAWDKQSEILGEDGATKALGPKPPIVTLKDVQQALEVNDLAPRWIDPQLAVSYTPINRTDAVRAFQIGAFTEERLYHAFRDVGYSDTDAKTLVLYHSQDKARKRSNTTGTWSIRKITTYYKRGYITRAQAVELMTPLQPGKAAVEEILDSADAEVAADRVAAIIKGVRRGFYAGMFSAEDAAKLLHAANVEPVKARQLVDMWTIERDSRYKQLSAKDASDMLKKGLIGVEECRRRLRNLGYVLRDADLIVARAMQIEGKDGGIEPSELDEAINLAVRSQKDARKASEAQLATRENTLARELQRIRDERNRRRAIGNEGKLDPIVIP